MNRLSQRPISTKAILSERPNSAHYPGSKRTNRFSFTNNVPLLPLHRPSGLQDIGTSTSPLKFEEFEVTTVPVQNITFKATPRIKSQGSRRRRVLVVKYLKTHEMQNTPHSKNSNRSLVKFFDIAQKQESPKKSPNSRIATTSRPNTGKSQGPVHKRVFSEINLDYPAGSRLFDICEVLSIAQGEINLRNLKLKH